MKNIHIYNKSKYMSLIMAIIILFTTVLSSSDNIFGADSTQIKVTVSDAKGEIVDDAIVSVENIEIDYSEKENGIYTFETTNQTGKINITDSSGNVTKEIDYDINEKTSYDVILQNDWKLEVTEDNNIVYDEENDKYTIATNYQSENGVYELYTNIDKENMCDADKNAVDYEVVPEKYQCFDPSCNEEDCNNGSNYITGINYFEDAENNKNYIKIEYNSLGKAKMIVKPVNRYYRNIEIELNIKNDVKFSTTGNSSFVYDESIKVESENGIISKITKILSKDECINNTSGNNNLGKITISADALYDDLVYTVDDVVVDSNDFFIDRTGSKNIKAISKKTGDSAICILDVEGQKENIIFKEEDKVITSKTVNLKDFDGNAATDIVSAMLEDNSDKYNDISYTSSDSNIVDVDKKTGKVYIKNAGTVVISAKATPKAEYIFLEDAVGSYTLDVKPIDLSIKVENIITGEKYNKEQMIGTISDESVYFKYEENGNGTDFTLPIKVYVNNTETTDVQIKAENLTIKKSDGKFVITNPDSIERNAIIEFSIMTCFDGNKYKNISEKFYLIVSGEKNNNEGNKYYTLNVDLNIGADGNRWFRGNPGDVRFIGQEYTVDDVLKIYEMSNKKYGHFSSEYNPGLTKTTNRANKEIKFYVKINETLDFIIQREYFGIDNNKPDITEAALSKGNITSHGIYFNDNIEFSVTVKDEETNLYDVSLFYGKDISFFDCENNASTTVVNGNVVPENVDMSKALSTKQIYVKGSKKYENCGEYTADFVIEKGWFSDNKAKDFVVLVRDKAGNCTAEHVGKLLNNNTGNETNTQDILNLLIEEKKPNGRISSADDVNVYEKDNIKYIKDNTQLNIILSDIFETNDISHLLSYKLKVNGTTYIDIKNNIIDSRFQNQDVSLSDDKKISELEFKLNTADFTDNSQKVNTLTIELTDIYDNAGNKGDDEKFIVCIDSEPGDVKLEQINTTGEINITSYGNFFNKNTTLTFNVSDTASGVKSVKMEVGSMVINGDIKNGKVSFDLPVGAIGQAKVIIIDNVENNYAYTLGETCTGNIIINDNNYKTGINNNYILIEEKGSDIKIIEEREPDASGKWYNHTVKLNVFINDKLQNISSNIKSVEIYINNQSYKKETFNNNKKENYNCEVILGNDEIGKYINNDGTYTIEVITVDNAGNSNRDNKTVYIDNAAPVIESVYGVEENSHNTGIVTLFVKVNEKHWNEAGNKAYIDIEKVLDGVVTKETVYGQAANSEQNTYVYTFNADGTYKVTANSVDAANNKAVARTINFTVDNTAPIVGITGVVENSYYKDVVNAVINVVESNYEFNNVNIEVTKELLGKKTVLTTKEFLSTAKNSKLELRFDEEGTYTIKAKAVDKAKNTSITRTVIFTVDSEAPTIKISGVKDKGAYKADVIPKVEISDNYYKSYSIKLTKTGVYFGDSNIDINSMKDVDVTKDFITNVVSLKRGIEGSFDTFSKKQENDGVYTLTVNAYDYAGRVSTQVVTFSVNRFGSVYTFNESLKNMMNAYAKEVTEDFVITEYNADEILDDSIKVEIVRDGTPVTLNSDTSNISITKKGRDETGWYQNIYTIPKENFALDGIYSVTVASTDIAGNRSQSIVYDQFDVRFSIDNTKPELVKVTGLNKNAYNANQIEVTYEVFDSIGIKEVRIYVNDENIQTVNKFNDLTVYEGKFTVGEGVEQQIRFEVEDMAGNIVDSSNKADIEAGKVADFTSKITVTTNVLIRWYSNKLLFISSIAGVIGLIIIGTVFTVYRRKKVR